MKERSSLRKREKKRERKDQIYIIILFIPKTKEEKKNEELNIIKYIIYI